MLQYVYGWPVQFPGFLMLESIAVTPHTLQKWWLCVTGCKKQVSLSWRYGVSMMVGPGCLVVWERTLPSRGLCYCRCALYQVKWTMLAMFWKAKRAEGDQHGSLGCWDV